MSKLRKTYIQRKDSRYLETVNEFEDRKEACARVKEYRLSDPSAYYYLSTRPCKDWEESTVTKYITVTPAYGRDYKSAKAAKADWYAGKDFILQDSTSPWDGQPINIEATKPPFNYRVILWFDRMTKVTKP